MEVLEIMVGAIVLCFSLVGIILICYGIVLFVYHINQLGSTISTIIHSGIIIICIVTFAFEFKFMGIPYILIYAFILMAIGYSVDTVNLIFRR